MATTLTYGATVLDLPDDLLWPDEFNWQAVETSNRYTIAGALISDAGLRQAGRPITLEGGTDYAWISRSTLQTLRTWADLPLQTFTLNYRGVARTVRFDNTQAPIQAELIVDYADPVSTDDYAVTLRFIEV